MLSTSKQDILYSISNQKGQIAILIDPDKVKSKEQIFKLLQKCDFAHVDYLFIGGSTVSKPDFDKTINYIKEYNTAIPLIIFPGSAQQISKEADAILFLSLISGRNPDFLIGHHVQSAHELFNMSIEVIPTSYLLIDGGTKSSVAYVSQTSPIPPSNETIILDTTKAGILLGHSITYLDAGSGAKEHVPSSIINKLAELNHPVIVGGGIKSIETIESLKEANIIVIGNKIEENIDFLLDIKEFKTQNDH